MTSYGIQMYSVRDIAEKDMREALKRLSEMGYRYIEFAGFFNHPAEDIKAWLDEFGLVASGTHTGLAALAPDKIDETIAYHKAIGCRDLILPSAKWKTEEYMEESLALIASAKERLASEGITLSYHNHSYEFLPTPYGKLVEDELLARTDVMLELDTFWLFNAGIDPVPYCEAHKDRIRMIHLKDGILPKERELRYDNPREGVKDTSLGLGEAPIAAVREWALANGVMMIVESEGLKPSGLEEVQRCIDYLRTLEA